MNSTAIIFLVLVLSLAAGSNACVKDPLMTIAAACGKASTGQPAMLELCMKTLHAADENSEVGYYAYIGANRAVDSCEATERSGKQLLQNPSLPKELRAAYDHCMDQYGIIAHKKIVAIDDALFVCWFPHFKQDCRDAAAAIDDCARKLQPVDSSSPFYKMVLADRDRTMLACSLAGLGVASQWGKN